MKLRKFYLIIRLFLYSKRKIITSTILWFMIAVLAYMFVDSFVFERLIFNKAQEEKFNDNCQSATFFYNIAYPYYQINHYSEQNKKIYLEIPYELSQCYLLKGKKENSLEIIYSGHNAILKQYGAFSKENATYLRKYLIQYYIETNELSLAQKEFSNLLTVYRKIGCSDAEIADITRVKGDFFYQVKDYDHAIELYERAYKASPLNASTDYEIFSKIINRICNYKIANGDTQGAIDVYTQALTVLKNSGEKYSALSADMLLKLGDIYRNDENLPDKDAIVCYEKAIEIIRQLPLISPLRQNIQEYLSILKNLYSDDNQYQKANQIDSELLKRKRFPFLYQF